jgi:hypothetical protein
MDFRRDRQVIGQRRVSRRTFLRHGTVLAGVAVSASLLAACGNQPGPTSVAEPAKPTAPPTSAPAA